MSVNLIINGITYPFPSPDDEDWGQQVVDWATAVTNSLSAPQIAELAADPVSGIKRFYINTTTAQLKYFDGTTAFGVALIP